jgi:hypothetical protein
MLCIVVDRNLYIYTFICQLCMCAVLMVLVMFELLLVFRA